MQRKLEYMWESFDNRHPLIAFMLVYVMFFAGFSVLGLAVALTVYFMGG